MLDVGPSSKHKVDIHYKMCWQQCWLVLDTKLPACCTKNEFRVLVLSRDFCLGTGVKLIPRVPDVCHKNVCGETSTTGV